MRLRYIIEAENKTESIVYCPHALIENNQLSRIAFGSLSTQAEFRSLPKGDSKILISQNLINDIKFRHSDVPLHAFVQNHTLYIGPLIGIFTAGFTPFPLRPIGERSLFFAKLLSVQKMVGAIPFVFGEQHIDWDQGTIKGFFFRKEGWENADVPFPNVIYDRLPNRKTENRPHLKRIKDKLQKDYLIPWYNPGFFNKLDVHERLSEDEIASQYLPETTTFSSFSNIEEWLSKYGHIYIKPFNGSLGNSVHQLIFENRENAYYCRYRDRELINRLQKFPTLESLFKHVFSGTNMKKMIIQQGIHLLRHNERPIDFRVHTNKDESGQWRVTAIAAKIAGSGSVTTHVHNGGIVKTLEELFPLRESQLYKEKLSQASLLLSEAIERQMEGIIAEIGFDLGIDRQGKVWLFEANSKPGRSIFTHPQLKDFDLLTRKLSISFAVFLTEQSIIHPEKLFK